MSAYALPLPIVAQPFSRSLAEATTGACYTSDVKEVDADAIRELFEKHGPAVFRRALRILGNRADAEEATQEIFIRAMRSGDGFRGDCLVTTWLYRLTTNYCLNHIRDQRRRRELLDEHLGRGHEAAAEPASDLVLLRQLLSEGDEAEARAAVYVHVDGMSHDEAAGLLGVSRRTVGNLLVRFGVRARTRLGGPMAAAPVDKPIRGSR